MAEAWTLTREGYSFARGQFASVLGVVVAIVVAFVVVVQCCTQIVSSTLYTEISSLTHSVSPSTLRSSGGI